MTPLRNSLIIVIINLRCIIRYVHLFFMTPVSKSSTETRNSRHLKFRCNFITRGHAICKWYIYVTMVERWRFDYWVFQLDMYMFFFTEEQSKWISYQLSKNFSYFNEEIEEKFCVRVLDKMFYFHFACIFSRFNIIVLGI